MRSSGDKRTGKSLVELTSTRRAKGWTGRVVTGAVALATLAGVVHTASASSSKPPSTYAGTHLTVQQAAQDAYAAGFHSENALMTVVAIGIAESGLVTQTRNWHPEYGYRPASDQIDVQGPPAVWNGNQQMESDRGAWQISSHWWPQYTDAQTDDPVTAAKLMFSISHNGTDFTPWDTYTSGAAQQYFDGSQDGFPALRPIVDQVIASGGGGGAVPAAAPSSSTAPKPVVNSAPTTTTAPKKVAVAPVVNAKPAVAAPNVSTGAEIRHPGTYTTAYDYQDNTPSNSANISNPVIHSQAGGTGTYADPITVAVDHLGNGQLQFPKGTKFYVPNIRAYLIAEDTTGETAPGTIHLDMWAGGQTSSQSSAYDCMSHVTGNYLVIENPASNYAVVPGPLAANNTCRQLFGDSVVTTGAPAPVTPPPVIRTTKPPVTTTTRPPVLSVRRPAPAPAPTPAPALIVGGGSSGSGSRGTTTTYRPHHRHHRAAASGVWHVGLDLCFRG